MDIGLYDEKFQKEFSEKMLDLYNIFVRLFCSGLLSAIGLFIPTEWFYFGLTLREKILFWLIGILFLIACVCVAIGIYGIIWTF